MIKRGNIFTAIPAELPEELVEPLAVSSQVRIERIISKGHHSAEGFWYDQEQNEWVLLLKGRAGLAFADKEETVILTPGCFINIPAHVRHRVEWTADNEETLWLAVYY